MSLSDPKIQETVARTGHPAATTEQLLAAVLPYGLRDLVDERFVSTLRFAAEGPIVRDALKAVITPEHIRRLFTLWACLKLSGADEIHAWHLTTFEFVPPIAQGPDDVALRQLTQAAEREFTGLHACVFADGDVSFYLTHDTSGPAFASKVMSLSQFGTLGNR